MKVLLVDRLQHHHHRPLEHLVLEGRNPDRPGLVARPLWECAPAAPAAPGTCRTWPGPAATGGWPPGPASYSAAVWPSTPTAPSLRVRRYASRSQSMSMWWARVVNAISGDCLASSAIRWCFVDTCLGVRCLRHLSLHRFLYPAPPSLPGVPRVGSPASSVLRGAPTSCRPSRRTSFPSLGGTTAASCVRSLHRPDAPVQRPGIFGRPGYPSRRVPWRRQDLPGSWGTPMCACPALTTPAGPWRQAIATPRCCLPLVETASAPTM